MGITDLWPVISPGFGQRILFPLFVSQFIDRHGRAPRIAIDAYAFLFHSSHSRAEELEHGYEILVRNMMAKIMYLTQLNVSYVVVFDGKFKPRKKRNTNVEDIEQFESYLQKVRNVPFGEESYFEESPSSGLVRDLMSIFKNYRIDYIQSPGEAEAECAFLQKFGVVDYVITDDTDVFVFGAAKVLRNFSRTREDVYSPTKTASSSDYYATPVWISAVSEKTGLTNERLILLATLRGGDYSAGSEQLGIVRSTKLALCGTKFSSFNQDKVEQCKQEGADFDFSKKLCECFLKRDYSSDLHNGFRLCYSPSERRERLKSLTDFINECVCKYSKEIFGRNTTFRRPIYIDEYYTLLYMFPVVSSCLFKFIPSSLSFSELTIIKEDLSLNASSERKFVPINCWNSSIPRFNSTFSYDRMGILKLELCEDEKGEIRIMLQQFINNFTIPQTVPCLSVPEKYEMKLHYILIKILNTFYFNNDEVSDVIYISSRKSIDNHAFVMLKFNWKALYLFLVDRAIITGKINPQLSPSKEIDQIWLPENVVKMLNRNLLRKFEEKTKKKASPKKPSFAQSTTLDKLGVLKLSDSNDNHIAPGSSMSSKSPPKIQSPSKSKRLSPKRQQLPPGQTLVTTFFKYEHEDNPFLQKNTPNLGAECFSPNLAEEGFSLNYSVQSHSSNSSEMVDDGVSKGSPKRKKNKEASPPLSPTKKHNSRKVAFNRKETL